MDELTLFGKAMAYRDDATGGSWVTGNKELPIIVYSWLKGETFSWTCFIPGYTPLSSELRFDSKELARDDAERALRELYDALGEIVEPWKGGQPYEDGSYEVAVEFDDGERYVYVEHWSASGWSGDQFAYSRRDELKRAVYAWRPMPKAPPRKP
jgi:hypothetical protein